MTDAEVSTRYSGGLKSDYYDDFTMERLIEQLKSKVTPRPTISDAEVKAQFATVTLRVILFRHTAGKDPDEANAFARQRADAVLSRIRAGEDFNKIAAAESDDQRWKETGGLEKPVWVLALDPERQQAVATLKVGEISGVLPTSLGYEIIKVE